MQREEGNHGDKLVVNPAKPRKDGTKNEWFRTGKNPVLSDGKKNNKQRPTMRRTTYNCNFKATPIPHYLYSISPISFTKLLQAESREMDGNLMRLRGVLLKGTVSVWSRRDSGGVSNEVELERILENGWSSMCCILTALNPIARIKYGIRLLK